ncbi:MULTISPECIES: hypothetical protein [Bacillaceae]|uniref:hypothetical protein n=1 Tax=Bacillaceae TaxID=186817 RepID=UPI0030003BF4
MTNHFSREVDALQLGIYQLAFACVYATIGTFLCETLVLPHSSIQWFPILRLAIISSAYGCIMQPIA